MTTMYLFPVLLASAALSADLQPQARPKHCTEASEAAVAAAVLWLSGQQYKAGFWADAQAAGSYDVGRRRVTNTAMVLLAYLAHGDQPDRGRWAPQVKAGTLWLLRVQDKDGRFTDDSEGTRPIYGHCYAVLALSEMSGTLADEHIETRLTRAVDKGVAVIVQAQSRRGGWGYGWAGTRWTGLDTHEDEDEGSTTIMCVQALRAAHNAAFAVPLKVIESGLDYLCKQQNARGGIVYKPGMHDSCPAITGAALASFFMCGVYPADHASDSKRRRKWAAAQTRCLFYLERYWFDGLGQGKSDGGGIPDDEEQSERPWEAPEAFKFVPEPAEVSYFSFYAHLYLAQAMWLSGDKAWDRYFPHVRDWLLSPKMRETTLDHWKADHNSGRFYTTAAALIILQTPHQRLPILQR